MNGESHDQAGPGAPYSSEWDAPSDVSAGWGDGGQRGGALLAVRRAAVFLWILGGVGVLMWTCLGGTLLWMGLTSRATLERVIQVQLMRPEQREAYALLLEYKPQLPVLGTAVLILGVLPALAGIILAFFVRGQRRGAILAALLVVGFQTMLLVLYLVGSIAQGAAAGLMEAAIIAGPILILCLFTLRWLWQALAAMKPGSRADADVNGRV
jgi:hypothetical protein